MTNPQKTVQTTGWLFFREKPDVFAASAFATLGEQKCNARLNVSDKCLRDGTGSRLYFGSTVSRSSAVPECRERPSGISRRRCTLDGP